MLAMAFLTFQMAIRLMVFLVLFKLVLTQLGRRGRRKSKSTSPPILPTARPADFQLIDSIKSQLIIPSQVVNESVPPFKNSKFMEPGSGQMVLIDTGTEDFDRPFLNTYLPPDDSRINFWIILILIIWATALVLLSVGCAVLQFNSPNTQLELSLPTEQTIIADTGEATLPETSNTSSNTHNMDQ